MSAPPMPDPAFDGAMAELTRGCPVFPVRAPVFTDGGAICSCTAGASCPVPGKHPHVKNWTGSNPDEPVGYSTDPAQIRIWAAKWPRCNWGGLTGKRAGRILLETDPRAGGDDGLYELEQAYGPLPETRTYRSGSGGPHHVFAYPDGVGYIANSAGELAAGVDVRGDGGMGILPGSLHKSGNRYALVDDLPLAELPAAWLAALVDRDAPERATTNEEPYDGPRAACAPIMAGCAFMAHAREDAATLSEPDWFAALSIVANTEDGIEHAHQLSEPYPLYSYDETQAKAERAQTVNKPMTCAEIASRTHGRWCDGCQHRGRIKSPIVLGLSQPVKTWEQLAKATVPDREKVSDTGETAVSESNESLFRTAREIVETVPAAMPWLCHGLVARGVVTEIDGKAKSAGKTTFLMAMIAAMRSGRAFLGLATKPAGVVYLSEQTPGTIRGALMRAGLGEAENLHLMSYADTRGKPWSDIAALAVAYALEVGAGVLIVDTLPQYAGLQGESENHSGAALAAMLPLQLAAGAGLAVVAVRHDRKGGGAVGESGRGSSAYAGAVDIVAQLAKPDGFTRPGIRHLSTVSRFDESPESLVFELTEAGYIVHGTEAAVKTKEARAAIVAALPELEADALTKDELAKEAEVSRTLTSNVLKELIDARIATRYGTGKKGNAYRFARFSRPDSDTEKPSEKLSDTPKNVVLSESFLNSDSVLTKGTDRNHVDPWTETELVSDTTSHIGMSETNGKETRQDTADGANGYYARRMAELAAREAAR